jgi:uncharacterized repeat protein (TIGR02543 family)
MKVLFFSFLAIILAVGFLGCDPAGGEDYTVTFDLDGGDINGSTDPVNIPAKYGETIANLPEPQKQNFAFGGWFTAKDGVGNQFTNLTSVTSDLTVFAKWTSVANFSIKGTWSWTGTGTFIGESGNIYGITLITIVFSDNTFDLSETITTVDGYPVPMSLKLKGSYSFSGNNVSMTITDESWDDGNNWISSSQPAMVATISGNVLSSSSFQSITLQKQ